MMLAYEIWTWAAIAALALGSIAVFATFLAASLRQLYGARNPDTQPHAKGKTPPIPGA
jgi:hypothetical protein